MKTQRQKDEKRKGGPPPMKIPSILAPSSLLLLLHPFATPNVRDAVVVAEAAARNGGVGVGGGGLRSNSIAVEKELVRDAAAAASPSEEEAEASRKLLFETTKKVRKGKKKTRTDVVAKKVPRGGRRRKPRPTRKPDDESEREEERPESPPLYVSTSGPLPVTLKRFGPSVLDPYESCDELRYDLIMALRYRANHLIERNKDWTSREYHIMDNDVMVADAGSRDVAKDATTSSSSSDGGGGETSYGTNNQDENVDEADSVKSDGTCVYAAYGDAIVVSDAKTGNVLGTAIVPASDGGSGTEKSSSSEAAGAGGIAKPTALFSDERIGILPDPTRTRPRVRSLLLDADSNRLVAIATMHGHYYRFGDASSSSSVLSGWGSTHVRIYDTSSASSTGKLTLLAVRDLQGNYQSARSIGSNAYVVTMSNVVTWHHFDRHFERYNFEVKTAEEYVAQATVTAEKVVTDFAERLMIEMADLDGRCSNLVQINVMDTTTGGDGDGDGGSKADDDAPEDMEGSDGLLKGLAQIAAFDVAAEYPPATAATTKEPETSTTTMPQEEELVVTPAIVNASVTSAFLPAHSAEVYASKDFLVLAGRGHMYDADAQTYKQRAYLLGFRLTDDGNAAVVASATGSLEGYLLNQFAMDEHDGYLRVASSVRRSWGRTTVVDEETGEPTSVWRQIGDNRNSVTIFRFPDSTDDAAANGELEVVGKLDEGLGKPGELIHSTRFVGDYAYVVTFERIDPFYTIDLTDPSKPVVVGELEISGFSNYLHPIDDNLIIAAGQDAHNETGRPIGFQISLFNVSDHSDPKLVAKYVLENGDGGSSGSAAQHDHRALRWLPLSKVLIIPVYEYDHKNPQNNFDGFVAYDVSPTSGIRPRFEVSHARGSTMYGGCWYPAYLSPRSMVFDGVLTTMKGHAVEGRRLSDGTFVWERNYDGVMPEESYSCMDYVQTRFLP